jgi:hypothetical protein
VQAVGCGLVTDAESGRRTYGRQKATRFALDNARLIPGLRNQYGGMPDLHYMPVDILTEKKAPVVRKEGMGMSGREILQEVAEWVETRSGNISKVRQPSCRAQSGGQPANAMTGGACFGNY